MHSAHMHVAHYTDMHIYGCMHTIDVFAMERKLLTLNACQY